MKALVGTLMDVIWTSPFASVGLKVSPSKMHSGQARPGRKHAMPSTVMHKKKNEVESDRGEQILRSHLFKHVFYRKKFTLFLSSPSPPLVLFSKTFVFLNKPYTLSAKIPSASSC